MSNHMVGANRRADDRRVTNLSIARPRPRLALALLGVLLAFAVPAAARADGVLLYEHINEQGNSFGTSSLWGPIGLGIQDSIPDFRREKLPCGCKDFNDRVSSLHVPAYTCVNLYEDINYQGRSIGYCGANNRWHYGAAGDYNLPADWNDRASSAKMFEAVSGWCGWGYC